MGDVEIPDTPCSWAGKCMNSEGKCQPCNASPFPNDDRCVCGPGSADWIKPGTCTACTEDVEIPDTPCSWAGKCMNSEGKCQPCNASPFPNDDRCMCGPGSADWIKPGTCTACTSTPALALPCTSTPSKVCGNPNINCYLDYSCDGHPPPVQCNAGGVGQECRYCGPGTEAGGYVPCLS